MITFNQLKKRYHVGNGAHEYYRWYEVFPNIDMKYSSQAFRYYRHDTTIFHNPYHAAVITKNCMHWFWNGEHIATMTKLTPKAGYPGEWVFNDGLQPDNHKWVKDNNIDLCNLSKDDVSLIKLVWG